MESHLKKAEPEQEGASNVATEQEWQELLGRALADEAFRAALFDDPRQAVRDAGYDLTAEQLAALKTIDLQTMAEALDERLVKKLGPAPFVGVRAGPAA